MLTGKVFLIGETPFTIDTEGEIGRQFREKVARDAALHAMPPKSPADMDRFWSDVEQACADRDEFTQDIIFDSFYL